MIRFMFFLFAALTLLATSMTYSNVGMQATHYEEPSVRSGSRSSSSSGYRSSYSSGYSSGGYRGGK